jgi:Na+-exporting ATPase
MVAKKAWIPGKGTYSVGNSSEPFNPTVGNLYLDPLPPSKINFAQGSDIKDEPIPALDLLEGSQHLSDYLNVASLANLAIVHESKDGWHARGDPTEIAMQVFVSRFNWNRSRWTTGQDPKWKQLAEFPFDSDVKRMSVIFKRIESGEMEVFTKGAVERILEACTKVHLQDSKDAVAIDDDFRQHTLDNMEAMAALGLRVLALASRPFTGPFEEGLEMKRAEIEKDLVFRGLIGLYDPPRLESAASVRQCQTAGIVVHMVSCLFILYTP